MSIEMPETTGTRLRSNWIKMNPAIFRYWGRIKLTYRNIIRYRTPIGAYLHTVFFEEAFQNGYKLKDKKTDAVIEPITLNEELTETYIEDMQAKKIGAFGAARYLGYSVLIYTSWNKGEPKQFYWLEPASIGSMEMTPATRKLTALSFTPPIKYTDSKARKPTTIEGAMLDDCLLIGNYSEKMGEFRAWIDPIMDDLIGLANTNQQTALRTIRISSGQRYFIAPMTLVAKPEARAKLEKWLENFGMNTLLVVPDGAFGEDGEAKFDFGIKFGEGSLPSNPKDDRDIHLEAISAYVREPREALIGSELGLRSAETNRKKELNTLVKEQKKSDQVDLWMLSRKAFDDDDREEKRKEFIATRIIEWNPLEEVDESERVTVESTKFDALIKLLPHMDVLGIDLKKLYDHLGIKLDIDEAMRTQAKEKAEAIRSAIQDGIDKSGPSDEDKDDKDDEPPDEDES